jgi:hypothetical protein
MRKHSFKSIRWTVITGLACLAVVAGRAYAEGEGPFINADVGVSFVTGLPSGQDADVGMRFSVVPGYKIYNDDTFSVSLQFETGVIWNQLDNSSMSGMGNMMQNGMQNGMQMGGAPKTDMYQIPFMAGVEYAFHAGKLIEPYIGVAGGGAYTEWDTHWNSGGGPGDANMSGDNTSSSVSAAVQGAAGVRFKIGEHMALGLGYKFLATFPSGVDYLGNHSVLATFIWCF